MNKDYRIEKASTTGMDEEDIIWAVIEPMWDDLQLDEDEDRELMASMTRGQRGFIAIDWLSKEVYNGGIDQFFRNSTGVLAHEARDGFQMLGSQRYVKLLDTVFALFPGNHIPKSREQRQATLKAIRGDTRKRAFDQFDQTFYKLMDNDDPIVPYAMRYLEAHPQEFFSDV
jgi:Domain of unknown function (DUF4375)